MRESAATAAGIYVTTTAEIFIAPSPRRAKDEAWGAIISVAPKKKSESSWRHTTVIEDITRLQLAGKFVGAMHKIPPPLRRARKYIEDTFESAASFLTYLCNTTKGNMRFAGR